MSAKACGVPTAVSAAAMSAKACAVSAATVSTAAMSAATVSTATVSAATAAGVCFECEKRHDEEQHRGMQAPVVNTGLTAMREWVPRAAAD